MKKIIFLAVFGLLILNVPAALALSSTSGLVAQFKLDEGSGTITANSITGGNSGTLINDPTWTSGKLGQALSFDGIDDQVKVTDANFANLTTMTLSGWINPRSGGGNGAGEGRILSKGGLPTGNRQFLIQMGTDNTSIAFVASYSTGQGGWQTPTGSTSLNAWHHVVVTYTYGDPNNTPNIYIDGVLQAVTMLAIPSGSSIPDDSTFYIGSRGIDNLKVFDGIIDQVRVYNRVLSASEISDLYAEGVSSSSGKTLSISGNHILADGQLFQVKGVQIIALVAPQRIITDLSRPDGTLWNNLYQHVIADPTGLTSMLNAANQWKVNTIRYQLSQPGLDPQNTMISSTERSDYIASIQRVITQTIEAGIVPIISMQDEQFSGETNVKIMPTADTWRAWQNILPFVANNPSVMLDLFNEPRLVTWSVWKNGGMFTDSLGNSVQAIGMQTLANDLRQAGSKNVLLIDGLNAPDIFPADFLQNDLISDPLGKIAYANHPRAFPFGNPNTNRYNLSVGSAFSLSTNKTMLDNAFGNVAAQVPYIAGEWDQLQMGGTAISCGDVPQIAYFEAAYLQKYTDGVVGYTFDVPGLQLTSDWNYTPRGYVSASQCSNTNTDTTKNDGDVGKLLYSWYHDGTDLWGSLTGAVSTQNSTLNPNLSTSPPPACQLRPACLDATPRCLIAEPAAGWCSTTSSSTTPIGCLPSFKFSPSTGQPCPTPTTQSKCSIITTLRLGSRGDQVKCLQTGLNISTDGAFGPKTKAAVIIFQNLHNLVPDGIVGPKTSAFLK